MELAGVSLTLYHHWRLSQVVVRDITEAVNHVCRQNGLPPARHHHPAFP